MPYLKLANGVVLGGRCLAHKRNVGQMGNLEGDAKVRVAHLVSESVHASRQLLPLGLQKTKLEYKDAGGD